MKRAAKVTEWVPTSDPSVHISQNQKFLKLTFSEVDRMRATHTEIDRNITSYSNLAQGGEMTCFTNR